MIEEYRELLPELAPDEARRIGGEQEIIARYEPERAVETLPVLLANPKDRDRLLTLLERVLADRRVQRIEPSAEQKAMLDAHPPGARRRRGAPAGRVAARFSADPGRCSRHDCEAARRAGEKGRRGNLDESAQPPRAALPGEMRMNARLAASRVERRCDARTQPTAVFA